MVNETKRINELEIALRQAKEAEVAAKAEALRIEAEVREGLRIRARYHRQH